MRVFLVEDDPLFTLEVEMAIQESGCDDLKIFDKAEAAVLALEDEIPDLILSDIHLKGEMNGLQMAKAIEELKIPIIFFTAYNDRDLFEKAKTLAPVSYLIKPFDRLSLQAAIELAFINRRQQLAGDAAEMLYENLFFKDSLFIKDRSVLCKVPLEEIFFIEADGNYSIIFTEKKKFVLKTSLKKMLDELPARKFFQVHRNFAVQIEKIEKIDTGAGEIIIMEHAIPLGRKYKDFLLAGLRIL